MPTILSSKMLRLYLRFLLLGKRYDAHGDRSLQRLKPILKMVSSAQDMPMLPQHAEWSQWHMQGHVFLMIDRTWYCIDRIGALSSLSKVQRFARVFPEQRFTVCLHSFLSTNSFVFDGHDAWFYAGHGPGMA